MDVLAHVPALPPSTEPGGCLPVDGPSMAALLAGLPPASTTLTRSPGGSAANVVRGFAQLLSGGGGGGGGGGGAGGGGGSRRCSATFHGMVGQDETGRAYAAALASHGVTPALLESPDAGAPTAVCACLVTPDGQRTMRTCLGAATGLGGVAGLPADWATGADAVHVEGYALWREGLAGGLFSAARAARGGRGPSLGGGAPPPRAPPPPPPSPPRP